MHDDAAAQVWHGDRPSPAVLNDAPATQLVLQMILVLTVHASCTPCAQVDAAVQGEHLESPLALQLVPPTHGTLQVVSELRAHASRMPLGQSELVVQALQGAKPLALKVVPSLHEVSVLHTTSAVAVQGVFTPFAHVPVFVHNWQGELPSEL